MVVISAPFTAARGVTHDRVAAPLTCTVHAPHCAIPHPNFVPLRSSTSRRTHSRGMSCGASTVVGLPLRLKGIDMVTDGRWRSAGLGILTNKSKEGSASRGLYAKSKSLPASGRQPPPQPRQTSARHQDLPEFPDESLGLFRLRIRHALLRSEYESHVADRKGAPWGERAFRSHAIAVHERSVT